MKGLNHNPAPSYQRPPTPPGPPKTKNDALLHYVKEVDRLTKALSKIAEWPDGGNHYGQTKIKDFAKVVLAGGEP